ncbi:Os01g0734333 [Oryza sativa Japonica Group]|uniref:Os01g0734333 protein n=1 Tax=Oryza sativa subsp. japonica TaxID=39947 RepID=A0A0P0V7W9_ORYSJ|nr:hypothetical protein EE612_005551 [Oryza sativa]BAS74213.1 Os01g0734333 [Oryza sativa Japonica Group]
MLDHVDSARVSPFTYAQIIMLSASANKLSRLKEQAEEYAALIMEELDPEGLGYIERQGQLLAKGRIIHNKKMMLLVAAPFTKESFTMPEMFHHGSMALGRALLCLARVQG